MIDVVVIGGGPVGLAAAIAARQQGLTVQLVERQRPPIDKACGEGLMPAGVRALAALGVAPPPRSLPFRGIRYVSAGVVAEGSFPDAPGRGIRRLELHRALVARAEELGVDLRWGTASDASGVGDATNGKARFVVAADGLHSPLRRQAGLEAGPKARPEARGIRAARRWTPEARYGVTRHLSLAPWSDRVEVTFGDRAEAYVTPLAPDEVGVAILWSGGRAGFDRLVAERFPKALGARLAAGVPLARDRGAGPLRQPVRGVVGWNGRLALVGDAAGYVDALTGEGLSLGFEAALALGAALAAGELAPYARRAAELARLPNGLTHLLLALTRRPRLRHRLVAALAADPPLFGNFLGLLGDRRPLGELAFGRALRLCGRLALPLSA